MKVNNEQFMERMNAVDSKIRAYARFFSFKAQILEEDDLYQEAMLKLYERYCVEPEFLDNTNSYIWCYAAWMMKNALNHENNLYAKRVVGLETEKGDIQRSYPKGHYPSPEGEVVRTQVREIACQMPEQYRTIFNAIIQGFEPDEIAEMLGITKWKLKWRKAVMIDTMNQAWRTPNRDRESIIRRMDKWPSVTNMSLDMDCINTKLPPLESFAQLEEEPVY